MDLSQISHECVAWIKDLAKIQFKDLMQQDKPTHWVLVLFCEAFVEYIFIKIVHFHLKYYGLFYSKNSSGLATASKMFHMTHKVMMSQ